MTAVQRTLSIFRSGLNAESAEFTDLIKSGVIDSARVTRLALQNAASIASTMLTTEGLVAEIKTVKRNLVRNSKHLPGCIS